MSVEEESITCWLNQLKSGNSAAAGKLWNRYVERLVRLARNKLGDAPRRVADEEDVVVAAFNGFLQGVEDGRFTRLNDRHDLWQILVMLTERRAIAHRRREGAGKRGGGKVRGESVFEAPAERSGRGMELTQAAWHEATPALAAELAEQTRTLLAGLADDTQRRIAVGKLEGRTNQEVADMLGVSVRTVERKLGIIRDKWSGVLE